MGFAVYDFLLDLARGSGRGRRRCERQFCFVSVRVCEQLLRYDLEALGAMLPQGGGVGVGDEGGVEAVRCDDAAVEFIVGDGRGGAALVCEEFGGREGGAEIGEGT